MTAVPHFTDKAAAERRTKSMFTISNPEEGALALPPDFAGLPLTPFVKRNRLFSPGATIYAQEDIAPPIYRLLDGCVALTHLLSDGRRQILDIVGPGRLFGFALGGSNHCGAQALTFSQAESPWQKIDQSALDQALLRMLGRAYSHVTLLGRKTAMEKVASAVCDLAGEFKRPMRKSQRGVLTFNLYLTRADLGDWLGLTIETVSRCLNQLKRDRIIDFSHPEIVRILDIETLQALAAGRYVDAGICRA
ncbi:Nitrogen fixation regulation protein FixK [Ensifer sp. M14]|uniref:helix-turn-helix domain-containing protein n=1 Tax=Ensifer sp. M14 TaxID=2203782 RepID=UPI000E1D9F98|nr:helix-turn-helix domain-containing protein [Ensifer sp. M14]RDL47632.1 Nitrogen fixation regulation protein FixK [Ensifer sp. M14]